MHCVVVAPIFKFLPDTRANLENVRGCHRDVAQIEQAMYVAT